MMRRRRLISFIYFSVLSGMTGLWSSVNYLTADAALMLYLIGSIPYGAFALITGLIRRKRNLPKTGRFSMNLIWFGLQAVVLAILFRKWYLTELGVLLLHAIGTAVYGLATLITRALRRRKNLQSAAGTGHRGNMPAAQQETSPQNPPKRRPKPSAKRAGKKSAPSSTLPRTRPGKSRLILGTGLICAAIAAVSLWITAAMQPDAPYSIVAFVSRYPEAASFAENYASEHARSHDMDVSAECANAVIPLFVQWDERWAYEDYGGNYLGLNGCGPTCMSMIVCSLTGDTRWNPYEMAQFADNSGYYYPGSGTGWRFMTEGAREFGLHAEEGEISSEYILKNLSEDTPMIASMRPGDFTDGGHYIVLTGIDKNGNVLINDPNSPEKSARSWTIDRLLPQIKGLWKYWA